MEVNLPPIALPPMTQVVLYPYINYLETYNGDTLSPSFGMGVQKTTAEGIVSETDLGVVGRIGASAKSIFASGLHPRQEWLSGWSEAVLQAGLEVYEQIATTTGLPAPQMSALPNGPGPGTVFSMPVQWSFRPDMFAQPITSSHWQGQSSVNFLSAPLPPIHASLGEPTVHLCRLADPEEMATFLSSNERRQKLAASGVRALESSAGTVFLNSSDSRS